MSSIKFYHRNGSVKFRLIYTLKQQCGFGGKLGDEHASLCWKCVNLSCFQEQGNLLCTLSRGLQRDYCHPNSMTSMEEREGPTLIQGTSYTYQMVWSITFVLSNKEEGHSEYTNFFFILSSILMDKSVAKQLSILLCTHTMRIKQKQGLIAFCILVQRSGL